jgi:YVTN family beta-propeller protein
MIWLVKAMPRLIAVILLASLALLAESPAYLILQKGTSSVAYYSTDGKLESTVPVGHRPQQMVLSTDGRYLYITCHGTLKSENPGKTANPGKTQNPGSGGNSISIVDINARKKIADISLGEFRRPHGIDLNPATGHLVVTTELPDQLLLIDPVKRTVLRHFATAGTTSHMVTLGPGAKWAFVSNSGSSNVSAIDMSTGASKLIATGNRPEGSALSRDGKELYVCNRGGNSITVIDTATQSAVATFPTGKGPVRIAVTPDGNTLVYALMQDRKIGFADPRTRAQTDYMILPETPVSLRLAPNGLHAFSSAEDSDVVYIISMTYKRIIQDIHTADGAGPDTVFQISLK